MSVIERWRKGILEDEYVDRIRAIVPKGWILRSEQGCIASATSPDGRRTITVQGKPAHGYYFWRAEARLDGKLVWEDPKDTEINRITAAAMEALNDAPSAPQKAPQPRPAVTPDQVVASLSKRPDLLYEVMQRLQKVVIVGPWHKVQTTLTGPASTGFTRLQVGASRRIITIYEDSNPADGWAIVTSDTARSTFPSLPPVQHAPTREEAEALANQTLRDVGVLFMPETEAP